MGFGILFPDGKSVAEASDFSSRNERRKRMPRVAVFTMSCENFIG
jgi:hypothetical protein